MHAPLPIDLRPGIYRESTPGSASSRWSDGDMVRFWKGKPERWRGWVNYLDQGLGAAPRGALAWRTLSGGKLLAFGTAEKLWIIKDRILHDITPLGLPAGNVDSSLPSGWGGSGVDAGAGTAWGAGAWGGVVPQSMTDNYGNPRTWTLAAWGEDLIACPRGGGIYHWVAALGVGTRAAIIPEAPIRNLGVFVTEDDRHLVAYGAHDGASDDPLRVAWPNQETLDDWVAVALNTAGDRRLENGNEVVGRIAVTGGSLLLTDTAAYLMRYIGGQDVFSIKRVGGKNGMVGPLAGIEIDGVAYWMGDDAFYSYDGGLRTTVCDVHAHVFDNVNKTEAHKISCGSNKRYGEALWFYPSGGAVEIDRFVGVNADGWSIGSLQRTTWIDDNIVTSTPIATDAAGNVYQHEIATTDHLGQEISYRLETSDIYAPVPEPAAGSGTMQMRKIIPDFERTSGTHFVTIETRDYPQRSPRIKGPYSYDAAKVAFPVRARAAAFRLRFHGSGDFRMGRVEAKLAKDGARTA